MKEIVYEDEDIILCHKPAGVATQTKRLGQHDMESLLKNYRARKGEVPNIWVIHRLDQPVEGLMVFAKNQKTAAELSKQVQSHVIGKYYYAVSASEPTEHVGILEDYLLTDKKANITSVVDIGTKDAKIAKLEYEVVQKKEGKILFRVKLHTGRQHQIRVQMAHIGCELLGDSKYGKGISKDGLGLCSYRLEFVHPTTNKRMKFEIKPNSKVFIEFF